MPRVRAKVNTNQDLNFWNWVKHTYKLLYTVDPAHQNDILSTSGSTIFSFVKMAQTSKVTLSLISHIKNKSLQFLKQGQHQKNAEKYF